MDIKALNNQYSAINGGAILRLFVHGLQTL